MVNSETNPIPELCRVENLLFDFTRSSLLNDHDNRIPIWSKLIDQGFTDMFNGENVNFTENRPALHFQIRSLVSTQDPPLEKSYDLKFLNFAAQFGKSVDNPYSNIEVVVNLGIGGSHLGPEMLNQALKIEHAPKVALRFLSNLDPEDFLNTFSDLIPENTLIIVASKTFTTLETLSNLDLVKNWYYERGISFSHHAIAVTSNPEAALTLGFSTDHIFEFNQSIGGRFSISSPVGLAIALGYGHEIFRDFLLGMHEIDAMIAGRAKEYLTLKHHIFDYLMPEHYLKQDTVAVLPYSQGLARFPAFLQQLFMESLGKGVNRDGEQSTHSGIVIFGDVGTGSQHSFMQLLHQGQKVIPAEFIIVKPKKDKYFSARRNLTLNAIAQAEALAVGNNDEDLDSKLTAHKFIPGSRPSRIIVLQDLSAQTLGNLISWYEHVVAGIGFAWNINPFDQWGVELGKVLARNMGDSSKANRGNTELLIKELDLFN